MISKEYMKSGGVYKVQTFRTTHRKVGIERMKWIDISYFREGK